MDAYVRASFSSDAQNHDLFYTDEALISSFENYTTQVRTDPYLGPWPSASSTALRSCPVMLIRQPFLHGEYTSVDHVLESSRYKYREIANDPRRGFAGTE